MMKTPVIAVMLADGFEDIEALAPTDIWRRLGFHVILAGVTGKTVRTSHGVVVTAEVPAEDVKAEDLDAVYLPGGMPGAVHLKESRVVLDLVQKVYAEGKLAAAICAAPIVLAAAGLARGHRLTGYPGTEKELPDLNYTGALVESDDRIVTGRGPGAAIPLAFRVAAELGTPETVLKNLKEGMFL